MCSHPIRLAGRIEAIDRTTGEVAPVYDTASEPEGVLHVAFGNRREPVCPACSAVYKRDARQLVRAGLAGGKGILGPLAGPLPGTDGIMRPAPHTFERKSDAARCTRSSPPPPMTGSSAATPAAYRTHALYLRRTMRAGDGNRTRMTSLEDRFAA